MRSGSALPGVSKRRDRRSSSGSLAMLAAIRRASSRVSKLAARAAAGVTLEIHLGERLAVVVADDEAGAVHFLDGPWRREAASGGHETSWLRARSVFINAPHSLRLLVQEQTSPGHFRVSLNDSRSAAAANGAILVRRLASLRAWRYGSA